jgi:hypothetical protein
VIGDQSGDVLNQFLSSRNTIHALSLGDGDSLSVHSFSALVPGLTQTMETGGFSHFLLNPDSLASTAMMIGMNIASRRYFSQANISSMIQPSGRPRVGNLRSKRW